MQHVRNLRKFPSENEKKLFTTKHEKGQANERICGDDNDNAVCTFLTSRVSSSFIKLINEKFMLMMKERKKRDENRNWSERKIVNGSCGNDGGKKHSAALLL